MKKILFYTLLFFGIFDFGFVKIAAAQTTKAQLTKAHHTTGKIKFQEIPDPTWHEFFESIQEIEYFHPFQKYMSTIMSIVIDVPVLKPPRGFRVEPNVMPISTIQSLYDTPAPPMEVFFANYDFLFDTKTHQVKKQDTDWAVSINAYVNFTANLLNLNNEYRDNCDALGIPTFYYKPKTHIDKNGYLIIDSSIRVLKKKGIPIYTPVTQKEYLEYKTALAKKKLLSRKKGLKNDTYKLHHLQFESNRSAFESNIKYDKQFIAHYKKAIGDFQQALNTWPEEKLNAPAYTSISFLPGKGENQIDLVAADYKGARELVRFNKNYFDKSIPEGVPQLITIEYSDGGRFGTAYMKKEGNAWFNQIDYKKLQAMIK